MNLSKTEHLEIEVKFLLSDRNGFRKVLLQAGAKEVSPRTYEKNIRFDTPWQGLLLQGKLLRLRHDVLSRLTFKGESPKDIESEARVREELEVTVDEFETMTLILERVGFEQTQIYEKYRETFRLHEVEIVIDEMPFGDFAELEGNDSDLKRAASKLGLDWKQRILANYLALMAKIKRSYNLPFNDVTFENFDGVDIALADLFEAEGSARINDQL
jgi:adenylate cyclase, class 2